MILKPVNIDQYAGLAEEHLGVFASKNWLSIYGTDLKCVGIFKDEHQMIGGFYYLPTKKFGFTFLKLPPYTPHCGLFFKSESKNQSSTNNFSKEVLTEVAKYLALQKSALTILAFPSAIIDLQPFIWEQYKVVPNFTYRIDLNQSLEVIRGNFDPKNRNVINKVLKEELTISENNLSPKELSAFFINSLDSTGANIYTKELTNVFDKFSASTNSFSFAAYKNTELLGVVFCIYDKKNCYYLLGGQNKSTRINGINNLLILKSIEKSQALGCTTFDFEGSMLRGVEKFFRGFGPTLVPFFTANKGKVLLEILLKFKKRELF